MSQESQNNSVLITDCGIALGCGKTEHVLLVITHSLLPSCTPHYGMIINIHTLPMDCTPRLRATNCTTQHTMRHSTNCHISVLSPISLDILITCLLREHNEFYNAIESPGLQICEFLAEYFLANKSCRESFDTTSIIICSSI